MTNRTSVKLPRSPKNFLDFLELCSSAYGDRVALSIFDPDASGSGSWRTLSYPELLARSLDASRRLRLAGLSHGDRVAILGDSSLEWVIHFFGVLLAGGVVIPLDPKLTATELGNILRHSEPGFLVLSRSFRELGSSIRVLPSMPAKLWVMDEASYPKLPIDGEPPPVELRESDVALICYTSGTLSAPKGVMLTVEALLFEVQAVRAANDDGFHQGTILSILPLNHLYGLSSGLIYSLYCGAELCFAHDLSPAAIIHCLKSRNVTRLLAVPLFARMLLQGIKRKISEGTRPARSRIFAAMVSSMSWAPIAPLQNLFFRQIHESFGGHLKQIICGGSELDPETAAFFRAINVPVYVGYGLTETGPVISVNTEKAHRQRSVGKVIPGVEVRIERQSRDDFGGEILTRGPNLMKGYYKNPELTAEVMTPDGWFRTGDLGWIDSDGYLHVLGRKKTLIVLPSGKKVHPEEVEGVLGRSPLIKDVCVIALDSGTGGGDQVTAVIHPSEKALASAADDEKALENAIRREVERLVQELATFKRPSCVMIRKAPFVTTTSMKIKRDALRAEIEQARQAVSETG